MKITIGQNAEWREIKDALMPVLQELIEAGALNNDERTAASEILVRTFVLAKCEPKTQTAHAFDYYFSAIADFQSGVFELYKRVSD